MVSVVSPWKIWLSIGRKIKTFTGKHRGNVSSPPAQETKCALFVSHLVSFKIKLFLIVRRTRVVTVIKEIGVGGGNFCRIHKETSVVT